MDRMPLPPAFHHPTREGPGLKITIKGASDDGIIVSGAITEEFDVNGTADNDNLIAISDGTMLRIRLEPDGTWRIAPLIRGTAALHIDQHVGEDGTDVATLAGDFGDTTPWVVHGTAYAKAGR
jgi:hypothetical protein